MGSSAIQTDDTEVVFGKRRFCETVDYASGKQALQKEKWTLEQERRELEREKREFLLEKKNEKRRMDSEKQLFEMKWKILEEELKKLADEKQEMERQKDSYRQAGGRLEQDESVGRGEFFFTGVESRQSLKKRYKELIRIYHPDNPDGDTGTIQEINREYDRLAKRYDSTENDYAG